MSRKTMSRNSLLSGKAVGLRPATGAPPLREPLLLRPTEAAHQLGIGRSKLFEMLARDELPVIRLGRCVRIPRRGLEIWVNDNLEAETAARNAYLGLGQR